MEKNSVGWFEIYVQDMTRAKKFYETVFKVKLERIETSVPQLWKFPQSMSSYGASGALAHMEGFPSGGNSTLVYFSCADCAEESKRIVKAGGRMQKEKMSIGDHGFIALAFDTEGNMFGLHSMQ